MLHIWSHAKWLSHDLDCVWCQGKFGGRCAEHVAIHQHWQWWIALNDDVPRANYSDPGMSDVRPVENPWKSTQKFQPSGITNDAKIKQPVINFSIRCDAHSTAVAGSVGTGTQHSITFARLAIQCQADRGGLERDERLHN